MTDSWMNLESYLFPLLAQGDERERHQVAILPCSTDSPKLKNKKKNKRKRKIKRSNNTHLLMKNFLDNNDDDDFLKSQSPNPFKRK